MTRGRRARRWVAVAAVAAVAAVVAGVAGAQPEPGSAKPKIRYTEYGIPHITASDYESGGEAFGFAAAKDNFCTLADNYLTVSAQRSRFLGPDGMANAGMSREVKNLDSDFYFQRIKDDRTVEKLLDQKPPAGPDVEIREAIRGYAKGYNRYLEETGVDNITDPACKGAEWVRPIEEIDVYRHVYSEVTLAKAEYFLEGEVNAKPGVGFGSQGSKGSQGEKKQALSPEDLAKRMAEVFNKNQERGLGSNALAVGSDGMANGRSLLLGNPHFPWKGKNRFWQSHLTVEGKMDVAGGTLLGFPGINIGHNKDVAWSHTNSTVAPFGLFDVHVDPLKPTRYLVDGKWEDMKSQQVVVEVRQEDGSIEKDERTLWRTRYGPITTSLAGQVPLPWVVSAHAVRDANGDNLRALNTWSRLARAKDVDEIVDILEETQGVPWGNLTASDKNGDALYADIQAAPNITDEHADKCLTLTGELLFSGSLTGTPVSIFDGKRSECDWPNDPEAAAPGLLSPKKMPRLIRRDYAGNANDSPWLANPEQPLSYPKMMGSTGTARTTRTQQLIRTAQKRLDGSDGLPGKGFSSESMRKLLYADASRTAELTLDDAVKMCKGFAGGLAPHDGGLVNVSEACPVLEKWDGTYSVDSRGSLLYQKFWEGVGTDPWKDEFDPKDPVNTPRQLDTGSPSVWKAFGNAVVTLRKAGIPLDAPLGEYQYATRGDKRIPIHGSRHALGVLNVIEPIWDPEQGNSEIFWGSSFIQAVEFDADGTPKAHTMLTYSQSSDPTSPHHSDQTELFSAGKWVPQRFTEEEIQSSPALREEVLD